MIFGGVGVSDGVDVGGGGSGCERVGDRIGWVRSLGSVGWLFVLVCCWWVLGSLVLPMVLPLVSGVSAGEGVVASGLGVGGGAGVGVAVRVLLGVAVRHSWLRAWWVLLCVLAASGGPAVPLAGCWVPVVWVCVCCVCGAGGACALVCGVRLWGSCRWRLWGCVLCARSGVCAVCWWCVGAPALAFAGVVWRPCLVWGLCVVPPPLSWLCGSPPPLAGVCWWCVPLLSPLRVPSSFCLFSVSLGAVSCPGLPGCGVWGGVLVAGSGPFPWCFPVGGPVLALPVRV